MRIESITIKNFRCFGEETKITFQTDITTFIGSNGTGKTAVMYALQRLFGISEQQRRIRMQDFHVPYNESSKPSERQLFIEAILVFPELNCNDSAQLKQSIPHFWHQLSISCEGKIKCRLRLDASWQDDGSIDGYIESNLSGIRSLEDEPNDNNRTSLRSSERSAIQMIYIPANRDGVTQVTQLLKSRLWKAIKWQEQMKTEVYEHGNAINKVFSDSQIVSVMTQQIQTEWNALHSGGTYSKPQLQPVETKFEDLINNINITFAPNEQGSQSQIQDLSDGQRSLFHLSMTIAMIRLESELRQEQYNTLYDAEIVNMPALTLIALEEPENCLSPFYLSKIIQQLKNVTSKLNVQSVVSSHSSGILNRIEPEAIRYFKLRTNKQTEVKEILLPANNVEEARKYVKEAVKAYPELYFSRLVIFGEGDSEQIILPRLAESKDILLDPAFIAVVPLGGRHVNHFWRLVNDLNIPHITLLDLDKGRNGGGWARIKYVIEQLVALGNPANKYISENNGVKAEETLKNMHTWSDYSSLDSCISSFEKHDIFFSSPLDIDWSMLQAFSEEYTKLESNQQGPKSSAEDAKKAVLKSGGDITLYPQSDDKKFQWYNYLFLGRGKPSSHLTALSRIENSKLSTDMPKELERLLSRVNEKIAEFDPEGAAKC